MFSICVVRTRDVDDELVHEEHVEKLHIEVHTQLL